MVVVVWLRPQTTDHMDRLDRSMVDGRTRSFRFPPVRSKVTWCQSSFVLVLEPRPWGPVLIQVLAPHHGDPPDRSRWVYIRPSPSSRSAERRVDLRGPRRSTFDAVPDFTPLHLATALWARMGEESLKQHEAARDAFATRVMHASECTHACAWHVWMLRCSVDVLRVDRRVFGMGESVREL